MAFSHFGIQGGVLDIGSVKLADNDGARNTILTASAQNAAKVDLRNIQNLTASYAQIDVLDVNEINSVTRTETTLEVTDKLIIAGSGSNAAAASGGGLQIGGTDGSDNVASVLYDNGSSALDMNIAGTTHAALSSTAFSASAQLQGASVAVDGAVTATSASLGTVMGSAAQLSGDLRLEGALTMDNVTISNAGAIAGATSIDASGDLTVGSITMAEFTVDSSGNTDVDGTLNVEGAATLQSTLSAQSASFTTIYGSGAAQIAGALRLESELTMDKASISDAGLVSGSSLESSVVQSGFGPTLDGESHPMMLFQMMTASLNGESDVNGGEFRFRIPDGDSPARNRFVVSAYDDTDRLIVEENALTFSGDTTVSDGFTLSSENCEADRLHGAEGLLISATNENNYDESQNITVDRLGSGRVFRFRDNANEDASSNSIIATFSSASAGGLDIDLVAGSISNAVNIDGTGDLTMGSITMAEFTVDSSGNTDIDGTLNVEGAATMQAALNASGLASLDGGVDVNGNVTISTAGAIAGATTIDASGDLTVGTITMAEFTVDASGNTDVDGTFNVEGAATLQSTLSAQSASFTTVYGSGAAQFAGTLLVEGAASMSSTLTAEGAVSGAAGTFDALAGTSLALQSGGITAAGAIAGATTIDGSGDLTMGSITMTDFAVDSSGNTDALSLDVGGGYGSTGATISSAGVLSVDGQVNHAANIIPAANGSQNIGSTSYRYNAVYANNVYTGDFHMKNERGDWTLFEESDHIRIRNNKTGQTFKLGMSLIEE